MRRLGSSAHFAAAILLMLLGFMPGVTRACSMDEGYRIPSNLELVQRADLIVLARVVSGPADIDHVGQEPGVVLETIRVLKGAPPAEPLRVSGAIAWNGVPMVSLPSPLGPAHFSVGLGACLRVFYPSGGLLVAMFEESPEGLHQIAAAWARVVEDVESPNGVWVQAIEQYLDILNGARGANLRTAVESRRAALSRRGDDMAAQAIAADLQHYLDVTAPGGATGRSGAYWNFIDMPQGSAAIIGRSGERPVGGLRCEPTATDLIIDAFARQNGGQLALVLGERRFEATGEATITIQSQAAVSGRIPWTAELAQSMQTSAAIAGIEINGATPIHAQPGDILQKLALRCETLASR